MYDTDETSTSTVSTKHPMHVLLDEMAAKTEQAVSGGRADTPDPRRDAGGLSVRERVDLLLDEGTFCEIGELGIHRARGFGMEDRHPYTDGVVTGWGRIFGVVVFVAAGDSRIYGGSLGETHAAKIHKVMDLAESAGAPFISLEDGAGARIQEGVVALAGYGGIFRRTVRCSGVIPQISVILGACAGGAAYSPALSDAVFMVHGLSRMFLTGPDVVRVVTGEAASAEELGGAQMHASSSGLATFIYGDEQSCLEDVRYLVSMLPSNSRQMPPVTTCTDPTDRPNDALFDVVPVNSAVPYDVRHVITEIVDDGEFLEFHQQWARNIVVGLARIGGHVIGVVGNQPMHLAGVLDIDAAQKAARFVQFCDAFNIALLTLVDVPGFLPGTEQEHNGVIRHGAKLLYAYCEASVPRVQLVLRKAYGGAYIVMDSLSIGADLAFAWPTNEIAVMGAEAAVDVIHRRELTAAQDRESLRARRIAEYREQLMHPYYAAERGLVDAVMDPRRTRSVLADAFALLREKHTRPELLLRKHGNVPM